MANETPPDRMCPNCHSVWPLSEFFWYRDSGRKSGFDSRCKPCRSRWERNRRRKDRADYYREYARRYPEKAAAKSARRRARLWAATPDWVRESTEAKEWITDLYRTRDECSAMLGLTGRNRLVVDHVVPIAGDPPGLHVPSNLSIETPHYNSRKSNNAVGPPRPKNCFEEVVFYTPGGRFYFDIDWTLVRHEKIDC